MKDGETTRHLGVVCPHCGAWFESAIQVDPAAFEKLRVENMLERCSACHRASRFQKADYSFGPNSPGS